MRYCNGQSHVLCPSVQPAFQETSGFGNKTYDGNTDITSGTLVKDLSCGVDVESKPFSCTNLDVTVSSALSDSDILKLFKFAQSDAGSAIAITRTQTVPYFEDWLTGDDAKNYNLEVKTDATADINQFKLDFAGCSLEASANYGDMRTYIKRKDNGNLIHPTGIV